MATTRTVGCLVFEGYADWEPALALATLRRQDERRRPDGYEVQLVGFDTAPVRSMGGVRVVPDVPLTDVRADDLRMLIVPGGDNWQPGQYPVASFESKLRELDGAGVSIAAICGATIACARAGLFAKRAHTSNDRAALEAAAPNYPGAQHYREQFAVRDGGLITARGVAPTEFACEILAELAIMPPERRMTWFYLFKSGTLPPGVDQAAYFRRA